MNVEKIINTLKAHNLIPYSYWSPEEDCGCAVGTLLVAAGVPKHEVAYAAVTSLNSEHYDVLKREYDIDGSRDTYKIESSNDYPDNNEERLAAVAERIGGEQYL